MNNSTNSHFLLLQQQKFADIALFRKVHYNKRMSLRAKPLAFLCVLFPLLFSCKTTPSVTEPEIPDVMQAEPEPETADNTLSLVLAGDIMAHEPNYMMKDFSMIWHDIEDVVRSGDLAFANIEAPVAAELGFDTYPTFNMEESYPNAAIAAGFNVFSLANNHTNDKLLQGIQGTLRYFDKLEAGNEERERKIYACGIKLTANAPLTYRIIEAKEWRILFVAVTELLNRPDSLAYIDYIRPNADARAAFKKQIAELREQSGCDFFVLSVHSSEEEYVARVSDARRKWYRELLDSGVDIVWANHPHVTRGWELYGEEATGSVRKMILYGLGNTISGQRSNPNFANPAAARDDTGDGVLVSVALDKDADGRPFIAAAIPTYITTYLDPQKNYIIKKLDDDMISTFAEQGNKKQADYFAARKKITEKFAGTTLWE